MCTVVVVSVLAGCSGSGDGEDSNSGVAFTAVCGDVPDVAQHLSPHPLWVWNLAPQPGFNEFIAERRVSRVYVHVGSDFTTSAEVRQRYAQWVASVPVPVWALGGEPVWALGEDGVSSARGWAEAVVASELFAGVQLGVEPQQLPGWDASIAEYTAGVVNATNAVRVVSQSAELPLNVAVPWWWQTTESKVPSDRVPQLVSTVDEVTVVTYSTDPNVVSQYGQDWLPVLSSSGKAFWFASDTTPGQPEGVSFAGETSERMMQVQYQVEEGCGTSSGVAWNGNPQFKGFAVHDYDNWKALPQN